jgi:hypothetical protein
VLPFIGKWPADMLERITLWSIQAMIWRSLEISW